MRLAAALFLLCARPAVAVTLEDDAELWTPVLVSAPMRGDWTGLVEINPRARGDFGRLNALILRPWLGRRIADGAFVHGGYGWIRTDSGRVATEHRAWQQLQASRSPAAGWTATLRPRLEQRWLERARGASWRARLFARGERRLRGGLYAAGYAETFVRLGRAPGAPPGGFDQQRAFAGLGRDGPRAKVEAGYQFVWIRRAGARDRRLHCLVVNSFLWPWGR